MTAKLPVADKAEVLARQRDGPAWSGGAGLSPRPHSARLRDGRTAADRAGARQAPALPQLRHLLRMQGVRRGLRRGRRSTSRTETFEVEVGAIILATGFKTFDPKRIPAYGYGIYPNVYTAWSSSGW